MDERLRKLVENPDTEWFYSFECEHDGDVRREEDDLLESGAVTGIHTDSEPHGDRDYYTTIYFKVTDHKKYEEHFGYPVWDGANAY